jgi:hypothetical protein
MPPKRERTKPQRKVREEIKGNEEKKADEEIKGIKVPEYLEIKTSTIEKAGLGLFTLANLKKDQIIGQYEGDLLTIKEADAQPDQNYQIFVDRGKNEKGFVIDAKNAGNYTRYINHACFQDEQNVKFMSDGTRVSIVTMKPILAGTELLIHYSRGMNLCLCFERYALMYQTGQMKRSEFIDICKRQSIPESEYIELINKLDTIAQK